MLINKVSVNDIRAYRNDVLKNSSASTLERKMFSLKKFFEWAVKEGYAEVNPVEEFFKSEEAAVELKVEKIEKQKKLFIPSYHSIEARIIAKLAGKPKLQKLAYSVFYARPKWYKSYHTLPISNYFNYAILILLMSAMGIGVYNQFFKSPQAGLAYPTALTRAGRYLSFQGRLTNKLGNPITVATNLDFKLYDASESGTLLWDSGSCSIGPDTDGIFSTLLGSSCGSEITSNVFTENASVWLGVTVGADAEATPRVQIATVAYALNSETLQGYPASASATANTVPIINSSGFMVLASSSPKIQSTSGNFALEGQAMTLSTPHTSNGSITINPDGTGTINLTFEGSTPGGSAEGFVNATNANLTSGSLYYGEVANDAAGYNLLELASGDTPRTKFAIDSAGNATLSGTINGLTISSGTLSTGTWNGTAIGTQYGGTGQNWSSVAQGSVPYFDGTGTMSTLAPSTAGYVLSTNGDNANPSWIPTSGVGTNYWQLNSHVLSPANSSDYDLAIGGTATSSAKFLVNAATGNLTTTGTASISGNLTLGNGSAFQSAYGPLTLNYKSGANTWDAGLTLTNSGYVGIGTTNPTANLEVTGNTILGGGVRTGTETLTVGSGFRVTRTGNTPYLNFEKEPGGSPSNGDKIGSFNAVANSSGHTGIAFYYTNSTTGEIRFQAKSSGTLTDVLNVYGNNVGIGDTTPNSAFTVGNNDLFQISSSGIITAIDGVAHSIDDVSGNLTLTSNGSSVNIADDLGVNGATSADITSTTNTATIFNSTVTSLSIGGAATTINLGPGSTTTTSINLSGGSSETGCTVDGATGNLVCSGTLNGLAVSSGTISSGTWNGTAIGATYGGTGQTGYAVGDLLYANSTTTLAKLSDVITGNVLISGGTNTAPSWGKVVLGTHTTGNYVSSLAGTANQITASGSTGDITLSIPSDFRAPGTVNAVNGIYTGATAGTQRIDASGNLVNIANISASGYATVSGSLALGNTTAAIGPGHLNMSGNLTALGTINGLTISSGTLSTGTWNGTVIGTQYGGTGQNWSSVAQGSVPYFDGTGTMTTLAAGDSGQILSTTGTGIQWIDAPSGSGTNYWELNTGGTIYPGNTTLDLLLGSSATASAKFAFKNVLTGTPTASISGTTTNVATFIDGNGNISTTNRANLVLGNSSTYDSTGNVLINPNGTGNVGIGTTSPIGKFDIWNNSALTSYLYQATADAVGPVLTLRKSRGTTSSPSNSLSTDTLGTLNFQGRSGAWFSLASISAAHDTGNNNARLTFSTADATTLTERMRIEYTGDVGIGTTAPDKALEINSATGSNLRLTYNDSNGSATTYSDFSMSSSGDLTITPSGGQVVIPSTASLNAGGITGATYNAFAAPSDETPLSTAITTTNDLFIGGDQEIKGGLYLTGRNIYNIVGGVSTGTITFATDPTAVNNYNSLSYGSWLVNNSVNNGIAALMVNQNKGSSAIGDIFTASASGTTKFTIHNDSSFTMAGLSVAPTSNTTAGTVYFNTATTTGGGTTGSLFMMGEDSNWHRVALDMTQYSGSNASLANASALTVTHNQNTADLTASGWVYNTVTSTWNSISTFTHNIIQNLQNQFDAAGSVNVRTQTRLSNIELKPAVDLGTGADGDITLSSSSNINTTAFISGRTCADAVNYNVSSFNAAGTEATLSTTPSSGCLSAGDEVLLINLQGISSAYGNTGNYETLRVSSVSTNVVTFQTAKTKYYGNGSSDDTNLGTAITNQRVMLQRVPNYNDVTISSGGTLTVSAWDGQKGGVVFFRANGTVTVGSGGSISATGLGYLGGTGPTSYSNNTPSGESIYTAAASANEGYGAGVAGPASNPGYAGTFSGGGGGSKYLTSGTAAGGAGNSTTPAGGGGGGGSATRYNTSTGHGYGGGGGGGGYGAYGYAGTNGSTASGSNGTASTSGAGGTSAYSTHNYAGGGGGGAGNYGTASLTKLYFGSGGGAGGVGHHYSGTAYNGGNGGGGGGIVYISTNSLSVSGTVASNGGAGTTDETTTLEGPGGGGAGGSIKVEGVSLTLGTSLVTASGGLGGTNTTSNDGGNGGTGLVAVNYATTLSGTTSPSATSSVLGYNTYGVYNSPAIPTANAVNLEEIRWEASPSANGKIELQTRSGNSTDPTDGTWEESWKPAANTTTCASPNCVPLETEAANYYNNWSGTNATVAVGDVTRDVDQYEDDNQATANKLTKITSSTNGGYAAATVNPSVSLSDYDYLTLWVRASQTGNTIKIGMGEIAATEQEETITIDTANTWQKVYWDLSDIPTGSRNAITKLRLTNLTSTSNTIYIGYVHGEKLLTTSGGSAITSTPNNYIQYRVIFTTTNTAYQPKLYNVNIDYNDGFKIVKATDNNSVSLYNYTGSSQNVRLDVTTFGADLAEWYTVDDNTIQGGDVVAITGQMDADGVPILSKSKSKNDPNLIGIISTNAGQTLGIQTDDRRLLALAGRVPVKIDPNSPTISAGDGITSSDKAGLARKATFGDVVIAKAAQPWMPGQGDKIFVIVNNANSTNAYLTSINDYQIIKSLADDTFSVVDSATQEIANNVAVFSNMIAANIKAGAIITKELVAEKLETTVATIQELTAPKVAVNLISPVPGSTNVTVQIGSEATPSGQFAIQNVDGSIVASVDNVGNASFSATVTGNQLAVTSEATIGGTLYADSIKSKSLDEIESLLTQVRTDQNLLKEAADWNVLTSTNSANLNQVALADLYVTSQAAINSLSVTNSLAIGTDMVFGPLGSLDTLTSPLKIQSLAMAPIEIMNGLVRIDTNGNVQIMGNLAVAGGIESRSLNLAASREATTSADLLTFQDSTGNNVASINTSGSANFANISTQGLTIAGAANSTNSASVDGVITTNATAGSATISAGTSEITIKNSNVTNYTLVYVTPTSSTENYVLYVKSKKDGEFAVGFTSPINIDVNFNWWIVKVAQ